ncbi:hypothetical protein Scep_006698 [Stephania cephalantha]|uniref:Uncharacterized protein n=1 Tax=Stephania cephalantha TaxID=152367 RepID=A0AAP0PPA5_9MAGN
MAERERSSRERRRRRGGATVGSGGEPADPASNRRFQAAARSYEGRGRWLQRAKGVQRRRASGAATSDSRQHRRTAAVADGWCGRTGETARRRAGEERDMAAAPARTSCGAAEHRFGWRDAATPAVTPAARHRRGGELRAPASGGAGERRAAAAAAAAAGSDSGDCDLVNGADGARIDRSDARFRRNRDAMEAYTRKLGLQKSSTKHVQLGGNAEGLAIHP